MKRKLLTMMTALGAALAVPSLAPAQDDAAVPLSLEQAIEIAEENNPAYRRAVADLDVAAADVRAGWGAYLPELNLSLSTGGNVSRRLTGEDNFGRPAELEDPITFRGSSTSQSLSLGSITLFDGGTRRGELRAARASSEATGARVEARWMELRAEIGRRYYDAQRASELRALEERLIERVETQLDMTQRLLRLAVRTPVDVLGAEVAVADQEAEIERARGEERKAVLALQEEMGVMDESALTLTDSLPAVFDPEGLDAAVLTEQALGANPRITEQEAMGVQARHRMSIARAARWPTLSANTGVSRSLSATEFHALFEPNPLDQSLFFGFSLSVPVFSQFRTSATLARARAEQAGAGEDLRAARMQTEQEVRSGLIDLQTAYRSLRAAERSAELNRERIEMSEEQYRIGAINFTELQDALDQAADAERQTLNARYEFGTALITLEQRVGVEVR